MPLGAFLLVVLGDVTDSAMWRRHRFCRKVAYDPCHEFCMCEVGGGGKKSGSRDVTMGEEYGAQRSSAEFMTWVGKGSAGRGCVVLPEHESGCSVLRE